MSIKEVALSLNTLAKRVNALPDSALKLQLQKHLHAINEILLADRIQSNEARNFQLTPPEPLTEETIKPKSRARKKS